MSSYPLDHTLNASFPEETSLSILTKIRPSSRPDILEEHTLVSFPALSVNCMCYFVYLFIAFLNVGKGIHC